MSDAIITRRGGSGSGKSIARAQVELDFASVPYDGAQHAPKVTRVTLRGAELVEWRDYVALSTPATAAGEYRVAVMGIQAYSGVAEAPWTIAKAARTLTASPQSLTIQGAAGTAASVTLQYEGDGEISVSASQYTTFKVSGKTVTFTSKAEGSETLTITLGEGTNWQEASCKVQVETRFITIYGVKYDGGPSTKWVRTDASALYPDPVAATPTIRGNSPFDGKKPWVFKDVIEDGNYFVRIDKFWIDVGMDGGNPYVRIADGPAEGFKPAPVFADNGDGKGEKDYVLVAKYDCGSDYTSKPGVTPISRITCKQAVDGIAALGDGYVCWDEALYKTLWLLYIVEYADWDCQAVIGFGCGATSSKVNTGTTDSLDYPTGTTAATRDAYGEVKLYGVEGVWSNLWKWVGGIRTASGDIYMSKNPADYSAMANGTGGTKVGRSPGTGYIKAMAYSTTPGFEWVLLPSELGGDATTYMADFCYLDTGSSYVVVYAGGGYYDHYRSCGILYRSNTSTSYAGGDIGAHFYKLPPVTKP